jgi:hypothetical protein
MPRSSGLYMFGDSGAARRTGKAVSKNCGRTPFDGMLRFSRECPPCACAPPPCPPKSFPALPVIEARCNPHFLSRHALRMYVFAFGTITRKRAPVSRKNRARIGDLHKVAMQSTIGQSARHGPDAPMALLVEIEHILGNLEPLVHEYGAAVMIMLTFESLGLRIPGESVLVFASVFAGRGELSLLPLMLSAWAGAVLGDNIGGTSKNRRFPPPRKSDSRFSFSERGRLAWDSLASSI